MAKDKDSTGRRFEAGQTCRVQSGSAAFDGWVMGGHEDGVHVVDADGVRSVFHVPDDKDGVSEVTITGDAPSGPELADLRQQWADQALALTQKKSPATK